MREHIIILPSGASSKTYPDNKIGSYNVDLDPPLELKGDNWQVALLEVSYPTRWNNVVDQKEMKIDIAFPETQHSVCSLGVSPGSYLTGRDFVKQLHRSNKILHKCKHKHIKRFGIEQNTSQFKMASRIDINGRRLEMTFSYPLATALGVSTLQPRKNLKILNNWVPASLQSERTAVQGKKPRQRAHRKYNRWFAAPDSETGHHGISLKVRPSQLTDVLIFPHKLDQNINFRWFAVKTNIIEADPTDIKPYLQRFVPEKMSEEAHVVYREFRTPQFKPLVKGLMTLKTIEVQILDELGRPVQFTGGKVSITLCLRHH